MYDNVQTTQCKPQKALFQERLNCNALFLKGYKFQKM